MYIINESKVRESDYLTLSEDEYRVSNPDAFHLVEHPETRFRREVMTSGRIPKNTCYIAELWTCDNEGYPDECIDSMQYCTSQYLSDEYGV